MVTSDVEEEEGRRVGLAQVIGEGCRESWTKRGRHRQYAEDSTKRGKRHREAVEEEEDDEESHTSVSVEDKSNVEAKRWEALGSDEENEPESETLEYEEGVQIDCRKHNYTKKNVTHHVHIMDRVVRVGFDVDDADVILRTRCTLGSSVRLNATLDHFHKDAVKGTMFRALWNMVGWRWTNT